MRVELNSELIEVQSTSLSSLLQEHAPKTAFAVAINGDFVPRSTYSHVELKQGDVIDIVSPMQGG